MAMSPVITSMNQLLSIVFYTLKGYTWSTEPPMISNEYAVHTKVQMFEQIIDGSKVMVDKVMKIVHFILTIELPLLYKQVNNTHNEQTYSIFIQALSGTRFILREIDRVWNGFSPEVIEALRNFSIQSGSDAIVAQTLRMFKAIAASPQPFNLINSRQLLNGDICYAIRDLLIFNHYEPLVIDFRITDIDNHMQLFNNPYILHLFGYISCYEPDMLNTAIERMKRKTWFGHTVHSGNTMTDFIVSVLELLSTLQCNNPTHNLIFALATGNVDAVLLYMPIVDRMLNMGSLYAMEVSNGINSHFFFHVIEQFMQTPNAMYTGVLYAVLYEFARYRNCKEGIIFRRILRLSTESKNVHVRDLFSSINSTLQPPSYSDAVVWLRANSG